MLGGDMGSDVIRADVAELMALAMGTVAILPAFASLTNMYLGTTLAIE